MQTRKPRARFVRESVKMPKPHWYVFFEFPYSEVGAGSANGLPRAINAAYWALHEHMIDRSRHLNQCGARTDNSGSPPCGH
jgi:hypothetical protein